MLLLSVCKKRCDPVLRSSSYHNIQANTYKFTCYHFKYGSKLDKNLTESTVWHKILTVENINESGLGNFDK